MEQQDQLSQWVIRFVLKKENLYDQNIQVKHVAQCITRHMDGRVQVIYSEETMVEPVIRIRIYNLEKDISQLTKSVNGQEREYLEKVAIQQLQNHLLDRVNICGIPNIVRVIDRSERIVNVNGDTGELDHFKEWMVDTEGTNLRSILRINGVDTSRTISNDVMEVYEVFGIEAATCVLFNEIKAVLSFDGSYVNDRHMMLLVDTMTFRGFVCPVSRHGMARSKLGP